MQRWIVDAMNVIGTRPDGWWKDLDGAMGRLATELEGFATAERADVTVVFDKEPLDLPPVEHITVATASKRGRNAGDHEIVALVSGDEDPASIQVVTSDRELRDRVTSLGATVVSSGTFRRRLDEISQ